MNSPARLLGVVLLAAGASRRMGQPKLLLPWAGTTILGHLVALWQSLAAQVAVVGASCDGAIAAELDRLAFPTVGRVWNEEPQRGMFSSVQIAARWAGWRADITHWVVVLGDQPLIRVETLRELVAFVDKHPDHICQPRRGGRGRHPVILPPWAWAELGGSKAESLRDFLHTHAAEIRFLDVNDEGVEIDLDTPEDYAKARA